MSKHRQRNLLYSGSSDDMEEFKINHYERINGKGSFPSCRSLSEHESASVRERMAHSLGSCGKASGIEILQRLLAIGEEVGTVDACAGHFDLQKVFEKCGITCSEEVMINWYRFDRIDVIETQQMISHFDDIWYPSSDDIDIFDWSMRWVISIEHHGAVRCWLRDFRPGSGRFPS